MKPADMRRLAAAGLDAEQIAVVMEIMEDDAEDRRAKGRARWRKHQENKRNANVSSLQKTLPADSRGGDARVEDKTSNSEIEPQENKQVAMSAKASNLDAFKAELSADLDAERMEALIEHRRRKRAALTAKAARMFRDDAVKCGLSLAEATDTVIRRNWIALEPSWLPTPGTGPPAAKSGGVGAVFGEIVRRNENEQRRQDQSPQAPGATILSLPSRQSG